MSSEAIDPRSNYGRQGEIWICTPVNCFDLKVAYESIRNSWWACGSQRSFFVFLSPTQVCSTPHMWLQTIITVPNVKVELNKWSSLDRPIFKANLETKTKTFFVYFVDLKNLSNAFETRLCNKCLYLCINHY